MHGNVAEWCQDQYMENPNGELIDPIDPTGPTEGRFWVNRGGSWSLTARFCGSSFRNWSVSTYRTSYLGFRVAATLPSQEPEAQ